MLQQLHDSKKLKLDLKPELHPKKAVTNQVSSQISKLQENNNRGPKTERTVFTPNLMETIQNTKIQMFESKANSSIDDIDHANNHHI